MIDPNTTFVAFDTETTGLSAADGRIVEIAGLKFNLKGDIIDKFAQLVNPGAPIPAAAMRVHRITDEMVAKAPRIAEVLPEFIRFFEGDDVVLIAQNALFDIGFVNHEALRAELVLPRNEIIDLIDVTRRAFPNLPTYALEPVCRQFNLVDSQNHRAMADSVLVMKLFLHCMKHFDHPGKAFSVLNSIYRYTFGGPMAQQPDEDIMASINHALEHGETLEIIYLGGSLKGRPRRIMPVLMFNRDGVTFLNARCLLSDMNKQFRLDRIQECRIVEIMN